MEAELKDKKVSELKRRALADGVAAEEIEATDDHDDKKQSLIKLISFANAEKSVASELDAERSSKKAI